MANALPVVGSIAGGLIGGSAAKSAAKTQANAAKDAAEAQLTASREANALQERMYNQNRADAGPWRDVGVNALRKLQYGLGLPYDGTVAPTNMMGTPQPAPQMPQRSEFNLSAGVGPGDPLRTAEIDAYLQSTGVNPDTFYGGPRNGGFDQAGYDTAMASYQKQLDAQKQQAQPQAGAGAWNPAAGDPEAGYLSRDFKMSDYQADPGYGFRLSEGMKALERSAAARGGLMSGAALKGISRYSQDYASNEFTNAFNRYMQQRGNQYNQLASMAGVGQTATAQLGAAGQNYANQVGSNTMQGAGNASNALMSGAAARASGYVGAGNAINQGIGGAISSYNQNQLLNRLLPQQQQGGGIYAGYDRVNDPWGSV